MKLLLISNSTNAGEAYLKYPIGHIANHLQGVSEVIFVPYAAVTFSYDEYERKVQERFDEIGIKVRSIHREKNPRKAIKEAQRPTQLRFLLYINAFGKIFREETIYTTKLLLN